MAHKFRVNRPHTDKEVLFLDDLPLQGLVDWSYDDMTGQLKVTLQVGTGKFTREESAEVDSTMVLKPMWVVVPDDG